MARTGTLGTGDKMPDLTLPGTKGPVRLWDLVGHKALVVYFYPKDETPGCTAEACRFRDEYEAFTDEGAEVVGISSDPIAAHEGFQARHGLPFALLSDEQGQARAAFGVKGSLFGLLPGRVTFVIDKGGTIRHIFSSQVRVTEHVDQALALVRRLAAEG